MADLPIAGVEAYGQYGFETDFGVAVTADQAFGHDVRISITPRNNLIQVRGLGDRNVRKLIAGNYEGVLSISFIAGTTRWLKGVFGGISSTEGTHTYAEADTIPSMTVEVGFDMGTTDVVRKLLGVKINSATFAMSVGEPVRVTLECMYKFELDIGSSLDATPTLDTLEPMIFTNGDVQYPHGTSISRVQTAELTIENGLIPVYGLGAREPSSLLEGARSYNGRLTHTLENASAFLNSFGTGRVGTVASTTSVSLSCVDSTGTGAQFLLADVQLDTDGITANPNELINEDVSFIALAGTGSGADGAA